MRNQSLTDYLKTNYGALLFEELLNNTKAEVIDCFYKRKGVKNKSRMLCQFLWGTFSVLEFLELTNPLN